MANAIVGQSGGPTAAINATLAGVFCEGKNLCEGKIFGMVGGVEGLLAENMMLAANSMGLGSVCLGSPVRFIETSPQRDAVLSKLGFSEGYELCVCIAFGYPAEAPAAKPRDMGKVRFVD